MVTRQLEPTSGGMERQERSRPPQDRRRLEDDLQLEKKMKEMLQVSIFELKNTFAGLEKRLESVDDEGNEWKTRYETQTELNKQLERQIHVLQEKCEHIRGNPTDRLSSIRSYDQMPASTLNQYLKRLDEEKALLQNQLKEFELRLEQETKAYYKVNDERRMYISEISQTSVTQEAAKKPQPDPARATRDKQMLKGNFHSTSNNKAMGKKKMTKANASKVK
ncbi:coiled-coil domain-containing protein 169 [Spea bombifrons]|uniref:coiled-coil domain-containing protein 169 n=1 Tax=Spea bombifrons TaxID=233779 RepID=UPI00234B43EB|nr:coiled-coil domain-containing protein 169 [Spea bombifrons]